VTDACDVESLLKGNEKEEPREPPRDDCLVKIYGGGKILDEIIDKIKKPIYDYNTRISGSGYYLKPVHRVYKQRLDEEAVLYEYYGRYWWKQEKRGTKTKIVYVGRYKPKWLPEPPRHPLEDLRVIREGDEWEDIIMDCRHYELLKPCFRGLRVEKIE